MYYSLIDILDYIGTYAFAISGVRLASTKKFDLFGAFVVGFVTAVGGGTLRDMMLGVTPFWMVKPSYAIITLISLITVVLFKKWIVKFNYTFFIFDAVGLALFNVVGIERTLSASLPMWVAILMGTITGVAGGVLRDVLINEVPLIFRKDIYAMACIVGGLVYWLGLFTTLPIFAVQIISAASVFFTRVLCVYFKIELPILSTSDTNNG